MIEIALIGHGYLELQESFVLPDNCYVIMYVPQNFTLSNSAIAEIAKTRSFFSKLTPDNIHQYIRSLNQSLDGHDRPVAIHCAGDTIFNYYLSELPGQKGVGSKNHQFQFSSAIETFKKSKIYIQDATSLAKKSSIKASNNKVSLENVIRHYAVANQVVVFHWVACASLANTNSAGRIRCLKNSVTKISENKKTKRQSEPLSEATILSPINESQLTTAITLPLTNQNPPPPHESPVAENIPVQKPLFEVTQTTSNFYQPDPNLSTSKQSSEFEQDASRSSKRRKGNKT